MTSVISRFRGIEIAEGAYLASVQLDLAEDIADLTTATDGNSHLIEGVAELLDRLSQPGENEAYGRDVYLRALKYGYWFMPIEFSDLMMAQLKYSGGLRLITDQRIKQAMLRYEKGAESLSDQYDQLESYFHVFEASQKSLFNPMLSRRAFDYIEEDFLNMLKPLEVFDPLVPTGEYVIGEDPELWTRYYGDMLYYKTALNNTNLMLIRQREMANALAVLIVNRYNQEADS